MAANQTGYSKIAEVFHRFLVAEKCEQCEIYTRMWSVNGEAYLDKKYFQID